MLSKMAAMGHLEMQKLQHFEKNLKNILVSQDIFMNITYIPKKYYYNFLVYYLFLLNIITCTEYRYYIIVQDLQWS